MKSVRRKVADRCEYCGEITQPARVRVYRQRGPRRILFERVPALMCRACGHRTFEPAAVESMEAVLLQGHVKGRSVRVSVVSG